MKPLAPPSGTPPRPGALAPTGSPVAVPQANLPGLSGVARQRHDAPPAFVEPIGLPHPALPSDWERVSAGIRRAVDAGLPDAAGSPLAAGLSRLGERSVRVALQRIAHCHGPAAAAGAMARAWPGVERAVQAAASARAALGPQDALAILERSLPAPAPAPR